LASREEIETALQGIAARFKEPALQERFKSFKRDVIINFTDLNASYLFKVHEATVSRTDLKADKQQVEVTTDGATFLGILNRSIDGFSAFLDGRLKVRGPISDLLKLQELLKSA
jgi:putative sterol carrier protein